MVLLTSKVGLDQGTVGMPATRVQHKSATAVVVAPEEPGSQTEVPKHEVPKILLLQYFHKAREKALHAVAPCWAHWLSPVKQASPRNILKDQMNHEI